MAERITLAEIYKALETPDRDEIVLNRINIYIGNNLSSLTDGILDNIPKISEESRMYIEEPYRIDKEAYKQIVKTSGFSKSNKLFSTLRIGLILSYLNTRNKVFLLYLSVLLYSSYMTKYFRNGGFNRDLMKFTIDNADLRTDFKRYGSLLIVLNKKLETVENLFKRKIDKYKDGKYPDDLLVSILQSISTRMNDMIKNIANKYYANYNDPTVKIMMQYSQTKDGKNVISAAGLLSTVREKSVDNLMYINDLLLRMCGYTPDNRSKLKYRNAFVTCIPRYFGLMSQLTSAYLDEWMDRNKDKLTIDRFKNTFIQQMSVARNIKDIQAQVDVIAKKIVSDAKTESGDTLNVVEVRRSIAKYVLGNIYFTSQKLLK